VPTASGDADDYIVRFFRAFGSRAETRYLALFRRLEADLAATIMAQDVIYVGGGSTPNLLAIWRLFGLDRIFAEAWRAGVVLAGLSAGALCWFEGGVTDSLGTGFRRLDGGLGYLPGSMCPHYDGESERRPVYERLIASGELPDGWAADDGAALVFRGTELAEVVTSRPGARAWRVRRDGDAAVHDELPARYLG
jgi:peptidase E